MNEDTVARARLEQLLEENLEIAKDTNRMVRDLRRWTRIGFWTRVILWVAVIVLPLLFIGSLIKSLVPTAGSSAPGVSPFGMPSQEQFEQALELYLGEQGG